MGLPVVSLNNVINNVIEGAGSEEFSHPFFQRVRDIYAAGDLDALSKERIATKLLRITPDAREGFILTDFPNIPYKMAMRLPEDHFRLHKCYRE